VGLSQHELSSRQLQALLRAAAQAICDAGGAMGADAEVVEQALAQQVQAAGTSLQQIALLSGGLPPVNCCSGPAGGGGGGSGGSTEHVFLGEPGAGSLWALSLGHHERGGVREGWDLAAEQRQVKYLMPGGMPSCERDETKRQRRGIA
ncbi:unnamed protein product, partial [Polarella glacialis]